MNSQKTNRFINFLKNNPVKIMIVTFIFILIFFAVLIFANYRNKGLGFYFDLNEDETPIMLKPRDLSKETELGNYFDLFQIELKEVKHVIDDEDERIDYGTFIFNRNYTLDNYYKDANISFRYVMTANWFNEQSNVVSSNSNTITINFPYNLPKRKNLLFKVNKPVLYIEITINKPIGIDGVGTEENVTLYYKFDLNNIEYTNVS